MLPTLVVVRLFIDTQNRLVTLHSDLIQDHEETDNNPNFALIQGHRYLDPPILGVQRRLSTKRRHPDSQNPHL